MDKRVIDDLLNVPISFVFWMIAIWIGIIAGLIYFAVTI